MKQEIQHSIKDCDLGIHQFGPWFGCPSGLGRECKICHKVDLHPDFGVMEDDGWDDLKLDIDVEKYREKSSENSDSFAKTKEEQES